MDLLREFEDYQCSPVLDTLQVYFALYHPVAYLSRDWLQYLLYERRFPSFRSQLSLEQLRREGSLRKL